MAVVPCVRKDLTDDGSSYYQTHDNYFAMAGAEMR